MKFFQVAIALPVFIGLSVAQNSYPDFCSSKGGQTDTLDNGDTVTYTCERRFPYAALINPTLSAENPSECIEKCQANAACVGAQFLYKSKSCQLFNAGQNVLLYQRATVAMVLVRAAPTTPPPVTGTCEGQLQTAENSLEDCEESENDLREQLKKAQDENKALKDQLDALKKKAADDTADLQKQLDECKKSLTPASPVLTQSDVCPAYKNKTNKQNGATWRFACDQAAIGQVISQGGQDFNGCLNACAGRTDCEGVVYRVGNSASRCLLTSKNTGQMGTYEKGVIGAVPISRG